MNRIKRYKDFTIPILEKSIGSEAIRLKHYSDIDKSIFYQLVNIDPTSVRKKEFSKPGKYTKWLLKAYKGGFFEYYIENGKIDESLAKTLNSYLFIFSTGWFKSRIKKQNQSISLDIFKYTYYTFSGTMRSYVESFKAETEDAKYDTVYSDDKIDILVPLNFTGSFETAKNTQWCSQSMTGYSHWNEISIMFRILPNDKSFDKLKLTWVKKSINGNKEKWFLACSEYPEVSGEGSPFDKEKNGRERYINNIDRYVEQWNDTYLHLFKKVKKTMGLVSDNAKKYIERYYNEHGK